MSEEEEYIRSLSPDRLMLVPHDVLKWECSVQGCHRFTRIRDFGLSPFYHWRKNEWMNLRERIFYCGKHWRIYKLYPQKQFVHKLGTGICHLTPNN